MIVDDRFNLFASSSKVIQDIVREWAEYAQVAEEQKTERRRIEAAEKSCVEAIRSRHDVFLAYLDKTFDERAQNFRHLFHAIDTSLERGDNQQLCATLNAMVQLAQTNPFQGMAEIAHVQAALDDPEHQWEF